MIRLYTDENVEGPIVRQLRARGVDVVRAVDDGYAGKADRLVLDRAGDLGRIAFARDDDFLREATRRQQIGQRFAGVIYARKERVSIGQCVADLELLALAGDPEDFATRVYYLPL